MPPCLLLETCNGPHVRACRRDAEQRRLEQRQRPHGVRRVARKIERDERAAGVSDDVSGTDAEMRQQLRRIRRGTRHEALGRSSDRRTVPVAATPVVNLLDTSQRRLVHQREEGVRDPRAVYEQHRVAGAVHHVLDVSSVNWGPLQVSCRWHFGIMRLCVSNWECSLCSANSVASGVDAVWSEGATRSGEARLTDPGHAPGTVA